MTRTLIPILVLALFAGTACKTTQPAESRISSASPQGEVITGETHEPLHKTALNPAQSFSFHVTIDGPGSGYEVYEWTLREGQVAHYSSASNANEIALYMEKDNGRLYLGMNFEGNANRQHTFGEMGSLPAMKVSVTNVQGEFVGRVSSGYLSIDLYDTNRGIIMGTFLVQADLNRATHELSGSFMMPLQVR